MKSAPRRPRRGVRQSRVRPPPAPDSDPPCSRAAAAGCARSDFDSLCRRRPVCPCSKLAAPRYIPDGIRRRQCYSGATKCRSAPARHRSSLGDRSPRHRSRRYRLRSPPRPTVCAAGSGPPEAGRSETPERRSTAAPAAAAPACRAPGTLGTRSPCLPAEAPDGRCHGRRRCRSPFRRCPSPPPHHEETAVRPRTLASRSARSRTASRCARPSGARSSSTPRPRAARRLCRVAPEIARGGSRWA